MADSKGKSRVLASPATISSSVNEASEMDTTTDERKERQWEVDFSRFYPVRRDWGEKNIKAKNTWLVSSTKASLCLSCVADSARSSVRVSLGPDLIENHFVDSLQYSWPQVFCVPECPVRGSRVIFMSYRDCSNKIQKFAVRFPKCSDAEGFLNCIKYGTTEPVISQTQLQNNKVATDPLQCNPSISSVPPSSSQQAPPIDPLQYLSIPSVAPSSSEQAPLMDPVQYNPSISSVTPSSSQQASPTDPLQSNPSISEQWSLLIHHEFMRSAEWIDSDHQKKKLELMGECEKEIEMIKMKYDALIENEMQEKKLFGDAYQKVLVNQNLAEEFRSFFANFSNNGSSSY